MSEGLVLLSASVTGILRVVVCQFLICRLLSAGKPDRKSVATGTGGAFLIALFLSLTDAPLSFQMALEAVWITVCAARLQRADTRMSLFVAVFYEIGVFFWQFLLAAGMGILLSTQAYVEMGTPEGQAAVWLFDGIFAALAFYLGKKRDLTGRDAFRLAFAPAVAGLVAVITLSEQTILILPEDTLAMWTILALILLMSILVFNMNRQYEVEKELARLKSGQAELLERDYSRLEQAYAMNARLFHDFHNHIGALRQLLSQEKYREAAQYLDELQAPVREMAQTNWTGDETIDYLINSKAAEAAAAGIRMEVQVEFPGHTNIRSVDLYAILGNLLDNAIEAAGKVPAPEQRFINLTIRRINQMLVIKVENRFLTEPVKEDGRFVTTKGESGLHGWGLDSARVAAEKYEGTVQTGCTGNTFRAVATLSYTGVLAGGAETE